MAVIERDESFEGVVIERILVDPETGTEIVFRATTEDELEQAIEAYFDPFFEEETGDYFV